MLFRCHSWACTLVLIVASAPCALTSHASEHPTHWGKLATLWLNYNESHLADRWLEYADLYERHLPPPRIDGEPLRMLEVGVQSGGCRLRGYGWG